MPSLRREVDGGNIGAEVLVWNTPVDFYVLDKGGASCAEETCTFPDDTLSCHSEQADAVSCGGNALAHSTGYPFANA